MTEVFPHVTLLHVGVTPTGLSLKREKRTERQGYPRGEDKMCAHRLEGWVLSGIYEPKALTNTLTSWFFKANNTAINEKSLVAK
jgi:hypothetical protein